jgi:proliferating cell nuclear antigen
LLLDAKFTNIAEWKSILQAISEIADEVMFICNQEGITFRGMDSSHVSLLEITFPKSSFAFFNCNPTFFGISSNDFKTIIDSASNNDQVELTIDSPHKIKISINGNLQMKYDLNLIEKSTVNAPTPKIDATSKISLSSDILTKIMTNIGRVSENVKVSSVSEKIQFSGSGIIGNVEVDLETSNTGVLLIEVTQNNSSVFGLEYMTKIIKSIGKTSKNVHMQYGSKTPLHMLFEMPSSTKVEYYLAPRITK